MAEILTWLKHIRDMIRTYTQMYRIDNYSQHSLIIWPVWLNGWVFVYELSGCRFESRCSHLNFRCHVCFEQGVPWHSGNYTVSIYSDARTWHDKNIQSNFSFYAKNVMKTITNIALFIWQHHLNFIFICCKVRFLGMQLSHGP